MATIKKQRWQSSKAYTAIYSFVLAAMITTIGFTLLYKGSLLTTGNHTPIPANLAPVGAPEMLIIPKIGVDAAIQVVGLTANGRMGIPTNFTDVAWYKFGPKPGDPGSSAINGHLDTVTDSNAVFARLDEIKKGDEIYILDKDGQEIKFRVINTEIYDEAKAPLKKIFDQSKTSARLNLITCDGVWNQDKRDYNKRLVVYSERVYEASE